MRFLRLFTAPSTRGRWRRDGLAAVVAGIAALSVGTSPASATAWPGGSAVSDAASDINFGPNLSGLAYQPSGTNAPGTLWAVDNSPSTLWKLKSVGGKWVADTANGWANGKTLEFPGGGGVPDAEGVTLDVDDANGIYVSIERNDISDKVGGVKTSNISRPGVLRFDTSTNDTTIAATDEWNLTSDLPGLDSNKGLEAVAWVPDSLLVAKGFRDEHTGATYSPATYPGHGTGIFFVGVEQDGRVIGYALNADHTFTRVATISSPFSQNKVMDLSYDPDNQHLWAACDDSCNGQTATLDIAQSGAGAGAFAVSATYDRPSGMANLNNEGFTQAAGAECAGGVKPAFWADDDNDSLHALRSGTINCVVPAPGGGDAEPTPTPTPGPTPSPTPTPGPVRTPTPTPAPSNGVTLPSAPAQVPSQTSGPATTTIKASLSLTASGKFAVRKTGKFGLTATVDRASDLTISATVKSTAKAKSKTLLKPTTRTTFPTTEQHLVLTLGRTARTSLRKGATITVTLTAKSASGATTTTVVTGKVK